MTDLLENFRLYLLAFLIPLLVSLGLTPLLRRLALKLGHLDKPTTIKTHVIPTPLLGGAAVFLAFSLTLLVMRFYTSFPTGTLRDLRVILIGGGVMFLLGLADDLRKPHGLGVKTKFAVQFAVAFFAVFYGMRIRFIQPDHLAFALSVVWIVGVSNAFNIIDIMDGLSAGQAAIAAFGFLLIAFPSESIYVNFASAALAGAAAGFLPYNLSRRYKIFMGDSGSLFCGFVLALVALGTKYSEVNPLGVYAPLFILAVPIYDTFFVSVMRLRRGHSPFLGSKDHFALRLEKLGFSRRRVVWLASLASLALAFFAWLLTQVPLAWGVPIAAVLVVEFLLVSAAIAKIRI
ncbi:MAG: undecaprenyl/decaprenyl-phosphate alpha-N-acetylglucosaminyl 1-phosphate transferase [Elusimicrobia bacterium CG08_land_8_20_14_0_20_59_10]|nr:MAG: undecaprenyl/decaprenyl-phosphate alpha-N-acetylglucosaminyl 1-phosphate transferase [Elusimicrobia bacterium CG08_land_8_20_14_0_20_59_10]